MIFILNPAGFPARYRGLLNPRGFRYLMAFFWQRYAKIGTMNIKERIKKDLKMAVKKSIGKNVALDKICLERPENPNYGDYSSNFAMVKFEEIKKAGCETKNPFDLARKIAANFPKTNYLEKIETISPGFINFYLKDEIFFSVVKEVLKEKNKYGSNKIGKGKTVVIDYSAPNIARPFGIGHLRSTIIGQAIYNLYKFSGYKIIGDNHLGDWGTQFGKLIYAIKNWYGSEKLSSATVNDLVELYIRFHQEAEKNPELDEQARLWFKKLEDNNKEAKNIWQKCIDISQQEFDRIYQLLGVKIDYAFGESFYKDKIPSIIQEAKKLGIAKKSQGALIIEVDSKMPPVLILKSDKATTYHARDLATIKFRQEKFGRVNEMIYEVGADHKLHFQQLFIAAKKFDWGKKIKYTHIAHGMMRLPEGKMSTRKGRTILLEEILQEAVKRAQKIMAKNNPQIPLTEKENIAKMIGIGAVKYNDLCQHYSKNIVFSWEKILNLQGNSGPYLQYTNARACHILKKAGPNIFSFGNLKKLKTKEEIALLKLLERFPETIKKATENYSPNIVCNYLFELAQEFNRFYEMIPVLKTKDKKLKKARLALVKAVSQVMENGLCLLGIQSPEKM